MSTSRMKTASGLSLPRMALVLAMTAGIGGCATTASNPADPFEGFNRAMFKFNDTADKVVLKPAATAYKTVLPSFVQTGIGNFFGNLADLWSGANNFFQGKGEAGLQDITRVGLNSTFGLFGLLDFATPAGLPKHNEDFGQTLGWYGVGSGPYLMLPLLGPSTLRDTAALPLDIVGDPWRYKEPVYLRNIGTATRIVDKRAYILDASNLLEEAALDRYEFIRDGFLQQRQNKIFDGESSRPGKPVKNDNSQLDQPQDLKQPPAPADMALTSAVAAESDVSSAKAPEELTKGTEAEANASL
ncbi:MlaA family lipoprotein [Janthinobacterium agaricidamnosum]|uniref:VacJ like lipofamily protein n=1 Tax=Janthinobacterium agaricidamnosum NBRC 102515 = DSM 9628 TaxID=1349767 RepID=W0UZD2_9BURK|nr:VacJ family lipoprotein [Janthinobacterium agaricidamnosum]CDG80730.1 vacJ like lipofamily protein [Janthinobacterium agaricidamnosum NBRC 102515 = DSM 9628]